MQRSQKPSGNVSLLLRKGPNRFILKFSVKLILRPNILMGRIGLIAALILAVCGLSDEEIFDDYEKSQTYLAPCMHLIQIEGKQ